VRKAKIGNLQTRLVDFAQGGKVKGKYHLVVNTMTLHHVRDPTTLLGELHDLLHPGGILGVADLDSEDGSFHDDIAGVFHFGFDRPQLAASLRRVEFQNVRDITAATVTKDIAGGVSKQFSVFLLIARRAESG
jgi:2-polyprenyl-3-methyl-5-hydroxy-6-metoxy-1,4-benzoquinol methylase